MFKFFRLFSDLYLGFWVLGLVLFAVQEIPYMVMPLLKLRSNPIMNMKESSVILDICEKILGSSCIALMTFVVHKDSQLFSVTDGKEKIQSSYCCSISQAGASISEDIKAYLS